MSLENRYGVPREIINKMVREGTISANVIRDHEILDRVNKMKSECGCSYASIFVALGDELKVSEKTIEKAYYTLRKNL